MNLGDTVTVIHPARINLFSGLPERRQMVIGGIYKLNILNYDQQHIFCHYNALSNFFPEKKEYLFLDSPLNDNQSLFIAEKFPKINYHFWEEKHSSFISAMKVEKFTYSMIGFIIVGIAGFTLMSMMSLSIMQKVRQIGILGAMGMQRINISCIFIFQAITTSLFSSTIGIVISLFIIKIDSKFNLIKMIFPGGFLFDCGCANHVL